MYGEQIKQELIDEKRGEAEDINMKSSSNKQTNKKRHFPRSITEGLTWYELQLI